MSQELIYTSMPRGLRPGSNGFCTVAMTSRMPDALVERLESLSGYRPVYQLGDPQADRNPVNFAHWRVTMRDRQCSVLSRVAFAGADYSQRSNKFAHHIVVEPGEQPAAGPAWVLSQSGLMQSTWPGEPRMLEKGRLIPSGDRPATRCAAWESATGDAGWAGVLADAFRNDPAKPAYIVYAPGTDILPLIEEALALLTVKERWQVTFSTYFTDLPMGATCVWRCVVAESDAAKAALRSGVKPLLIDLTKPVPVATTGPLTETARTGQVLSGAVAKAPAPVRKSLASPIHSFKEEPVVDVEDDSTTEAIAPVSGHRRLRLGASAYTVEEGDPEPDSLTVSDIVLESVSPRAALPVRRRMSGWMIALLCLFFLIAGGSAGWVARTQALSIRIGQLNGDAIKLEQKDMQRESREDEIRATANKAVKEAVDAQNLAKASLNTMTAERDQLKQDVATANGAKVLAEGERDKAIADRKSAIAALTKPATIPIAKSDEHETKPIDYATLVPQIISEPKNSPSDNGFGKPDEWDVGVGIERVGFVFPNGKSEYSFNSLDNNAKPPTTPKKLTAVETAVGTGVDVKLTYTAVGGGGPHQVIRTLFSVVIANGKMTRSWTKENFEQHSAWLADIPAILKFSAIVCRRKDQPPQLLAWYKPGQGQVRNGESMENVPLPPGVSGYLRLSFNGANQGEWTLVLSSETGTRIDVKRDLPNGGGLSFPISLDVQDPDPKGWQSWTMRTEWDDRRLAQKYLRSVQELRGYCELGKKDKAVAAKSADDVAKEVEQLAKDLKTEIDKGGKPEEITQKSARHRKMKEALGSFRECKLLVESYQKIGGFPVDIKLPNGILVLGCTITEPQRSKLD